MKLDELLESFFAVEDESPYVKEIEGYIMDLIISLKGRGISSVPFQAIKNELAQSGIDVDDEYLADFISNIAGVKEVVPGGNVEFNVAGADRQTSPDKAEQEQEKIKKTATKVAKDDLSNKNKGRQVEKS
jgi:ribosomal protein L12E/L44/L45/RPP1/RPP2